MVSKTWLRFHSNSVNNREATWLINIARYRDWADHLILLENRGATVLVPHDRVTLESQQFLATVGFYNNRDATESSQQLNTKALADFIRIDDAANDVLRRTGDLEVYSRCHNIQ